jgi:hypothetical protein
MKLQKRKKKKRVSPKINRQNYNIFPKSDRYKIDTQFSIAQ